MEPESCTSDRDGLADVDETEKTPMADQSSSWDLMAQSEKTTMISSESSAARASKGYGDQCDFPDPLRNRDAVVSRESMTTHERAILKAQVELSETNISFRLLYRYATKWDKVFIAIAAVAAVAAGAVLPLMTIIFGNLTGTFQAQTLGTISGSYFESTLNRYVLYFVYLAIGEFFLAYFSTVLFIYTGEHVTSKIREQYLRSLLRQNIGFFDRVGAGEITTRITSDTYLVQEAISEKVGLTLSGVAGLLAAFAIGFVKFWKLTLICMSSIVAILILMTLGGQKMATWNKKSLTAYALGGSLAEDVLTSIRNVVAFGTQTKFAAQYNIHLLEARRWGIRNKSTLGCLFGGLICIIFLNYGLAFWVGCRFMLAGETTLSAILTIIMAVMIGAFSFGNVGPNIQHFTAGMAAASKIYATINRVSPLDPLSYEGKKLDQVEGTISLRNIRHIYPSRPEVTVLEDISLTAPARKVTALAGASGCGKSTIVGLVERFYDPVAGAVLLDGHDIRTLNLHWLRKQISLVQQDPSLFNQTVKENIRNGLIGSKYEDDPDDQQMARIIDAAKEANAHDFISALPDGYDTHVGQRGLLLSGGQKQRIAIARAIVSNPKILLLDEATSALDTKSEAVVQKALDQATKNRTTIVIAHRLSTIKAADNIIVIQHGRIIEQGTHDELLDLKKSYYNMVAAQHIDGYAMGTDLLDDSAKRGQHELTGSPSTPLGIPPSSSNRLTSSNITPSPTRYPLLALIKFVARFNLSEWHIMTVGWVFSCIAGAGQPVQGIFFAKAILAMSQPLNDRDKIKHDVSFWSLMYLMLALVMLLSMILQGISLAYCSENLVQRARNGAFRRFLRQDLTFHDHDKHSSGVLTAFLSTESTYLSSISGATLGTILNCTATLAISIIIALVIGWKLALVCMCALPVILGTGFFRFWVLAEFSATMQNHYEHSAGYACEHINAIRTVASMTAEKEVCSTYKHQLRYQLRASLKANLRNSALYAASQSGMLLAIALGFWYGGKLMGRGEYDIFQFFVVFSEVVFGAQSAGTVFSHAGDMSKAKSAASELKKLYDRQPLIDPWSTKGKPLKHMQGSLEFQNVHFQYPTRIGVPVLRGLNFNVQPGQFIALVGASGEWAETLLETLY